MEEFLTAYYWCSVVWGEGCRLTAGCWEMMGGMANTGFGSGALGCLSSATLVNAACSWGIHTTSPCCCCCCWVRWCGVLSSVGCCCVNPCHWHALGRSEDQIQKGWCDILVAVQTHQYTTDNQICDIHTQQKVPPWLKLCTAFMSPCTHDFVNNKTSFLENNENKSFIVEQNESRATRYMLPSTKQTTAKRNITSTLDANTTPITMYEPLCQTLQHIDNKTTLFMTPNKRWLHL